MSNEEDLISKFRVSVASPKSVSSADSDGPVRVLYISAHSTDYLW